MSEMAAASKEVGQAEPHSRTQGTHSSLGSVVYNIVKKTLTVGVIYLVGYMNWSIAWLIGPLILSVARAEWRTESDLRRNIAKASAIASEKDVILARIDDLPAWVFFPDVERAEWLNRILRQVWPNVNHYARVLIKDSIEPAVAKSLAGYKLYGFRFERMILGTIPPRIGGVKVYDRNVARDEIIMDLDIFYAGDCDINFALSGVKGGIKDFQIHGMLRVVMKPLISSMPLVGGLQVFFLNNPMIDFNLVGVADLLDMPGLSDLLRRIIVEQVAAMMVLPNKLPIKLSDEVGAHILKMPEPEGVLRVHVVEAKNLMKKDISMLGKGKSDPYVIITVGAQEFRTHTIDNNVNPKWDYWCEAVMESTEQTFNVELFDEDDISNKDEKLGREESRYSTNPETFTFLLPWNPGHSIDEGNYIEACKSEVEDTGSSLLVTRLYDEDLTTDEFLGRATVEVSSVTRKGQVDTWLTLEQAMHGMVHLRLTWLKLSADPADLKAAIEETQLLRVTSMSTSLLTVYIDSIKNLKQARPQSKPDPYIVASVGKKTEQTGVQMRTDAPVFEQGFTFLVPNPDNDSLHLKVMDQKTGTEIGRFLYPLNNLLGKPNMEVDKEPFALQMSGPDSKILLSMSLRILKYEAPVAEALEGSETSSISDPASLSRASSVRKPESSNNSVQASPQRSPFPELDSVPSRTSVSGSLTSEVVEPPLSSRTSTAVSATPPASPALGGLVHRAPSVTSSAGEAGLGRIQLTLRYSVQRQRLVVVVHKIMNIPLKDPSSIPDPYVKLYLLPGRSKDSKRKTVMIKDNCNPVYDETFEYVISQAELMASQLEVTVATQKGFLSGGSPVIGQVIINLNECDLVQATTAWMDLLPEASRD